MTSQSLDFTLDKYQELCQVLSEKYRICTVFEYLSEKPEGNIAVVRHDVDRRIDNSLRMAELEHSIGIRSSYYFRYPFTFRPDIIGKIKDLDHEIGYHYEVLSKTKGDFIKAIALFQTELGEFRKLYTVNTICMHGSPFSKYDNRDLWERYDYHAYGITGEAFLSFEQEIKGLRYLTDTGRTWSGRKSLRDAVRALPVNDDLLYLDTTDDLIAWLERGGGKKLYLTIHPERWSANKGEWIMWSVLDFGMNIGKKFLQLKFHDYERAPR
jgi:hypothetical protein